MRIRGYQYLDMHTGIYKGWLLIPGCERPQESQETIVRVDIG